MYTPPQTWKNHVHSLLVVRRGVKIQGRKEAMCLHGGHWNFRRVFSAHLGCHVKMKAATWRQRMSRWSKKRQEFSRSDEIAEWCRWSSPQDAEMTSTPMMLSHWWKDATTKLLHWWSRDKGNGEGSQKDAPMVVEQKLRRREEQSFRLSADSRRMIKINDEAANARVRWTPRWEEYDAAIHFEPWGTAQWR